MRQAFAFLGAICVWAACAQAGSAITVRPVDAAALKKAITGYRGHVVLINFWATWCPPCMKEYPGLVSLSRQYKKKGLIVLSVSGDKPRDTTARILPFLMHQKADFPQFVMRGDLDTFVDAFQPKWQADFPQTFVYDKRGRLSRELPGPQTMAAWRAAITPLFNKRGGR